MNNSYFVQLKKMAALRKGSHYYFNNSMLLHHNFMLGNYSIFFDD